MTNLDMKKTLKHLYRPSSKAISVVDVPEMAYLMIDGEGNPNISESYGQAVQALYTLAYGIRAISKAAGSVFTVMPLEGLWSFAGESEHNFGRLTQEQKDSFVWTMMILQPENITAEMVAEARETVRKTKSPALLDEVRFESYHEGDAVQIMHIGSYDEEGPNIARLHQHIADNGWTLSRKHHEIYLSDPRKVDVQKMKTIIRQPFIS